MVSAGPKFAEALERQIRPKKFAWLSTIREHCLRSQVTATYRAFHRGRPARARPIAGKKQVRQRNFLAWPPVVTPAQARTLRALL